jgi:hypothetical protein
LTGRRENRTSESAASSSSEEGNRRGDEEDRILVLGSGSLHAIASLSPMENQITLFGYIFLNLYYERAGCEKKWWNFGCLNGAVVLIVYIELARGVHEAV